MPYTPTTTYNSSTGNLASKAGVTYGYQDTAHVHGVTHLNGTQKYWYDANGNQTKRIVGSYTYDLKYDAENRLVEVKKNSVAIATFVYNGDGERVQSQMGSTTTGFVGNYFEWIVGTTSSVKKYYYAGSQRVAMRTGASTLNFLLGDHLGSTSVTTSSTGTSPKYQLYKPFGEVRYTSSALPTKYTFTGQYSNVADFGLMYYGARWYDVSLGRFASADSIIPGAGNPLAWDRYAYTLNNPVKYTDPSGHGAYCGDDYDPGCLNKNETFYYLGAIGEWVIPEPLQDLLDIYDDPVELLARVILGEEGGKLFSAYEDDAYGVAWAIRNRYKSDVYDRCGIEGCRNPLPNGVSNPYEFYWSASSQVYGGRSQNALNPLQNGWPSEKDAIKAYNRARYIAKGVLNSNKSEDITLGNGQFMLWADAYSVGPREIKEVIMANGGQILVCTNCVEYVRTHFAVKQNGNYYGTYHCVTTAAQCN